MNSIDSQIRVSMLCLPARADITLGSCAETAIRWTSSVIPTLAGYATGSRYSVSSGCGEGVFLPPIAAGAGIVSSSTTTGFSDGSVIEAVFAMADGSTFECPPIFKSLEALLSFTAIGPVGIVGRASRTFERFARAFRSLEAFETSSAKVTARCKRSTAPLAWDAVERNFALNSRTARTILLRIAMRWFASLIVEPSPRLTLAVSPSPKWVCGMKSTPAAA